MRPQPLRQLVLVVEDDSRLVSAVVMMIEDWGYECVVVPSPARAAAALGNRIGDVVAVVTDVSLHESYTGVRSAAAIEAAVGRRVPVIATSSQPGLATSSGFTMVLAKPYDPEDLRLWLVAQIGTQIGQSTLKAC